MKYFPYLAPLAASLVLFGGATAANGATRPDDRATHGPGAVALEQSDNVVHPNDRATHGPGAVTIRLMHDVVRPDDRATHGPGAIALEQLPAVAQAPAITQGGSETAHGNGFDWLDAAIGAAAALGLGLITAGGVAFLHRRTNTPAYSWRRQRRLRELAQEPLNPGVE